jgi:hypothetical protein
MIIIVSFFFSQPEKRVPGQQKRIKLNALK